MVTPPFLGMEPSPLRRPIMPPGEVEGNPTLFRFASSSKYSISGGKKGRWESLPRSDGRQIKKCWPRKRTQRSLSSFVKYYLLHTLRVFFVPLWKSNAAIRQQTNMQYVRTLNMYTFCYSSNYSRTLYVYIHMPSTLQSFHERMEIKSKREFPRSREECIFLKKSQVLHSSKEKRLGVAFSISLSNNSFRAMWLECGWVGLAAWVWQFG